MFNINLPISFESDFSNISVKNCIIEVRQMSKFVEVVSRFGIILPENFLQKVENNHKNQKEFVFYTENEKIFQIIFFFPDEQNLISDRADIFRKYKNDIAYISDGDNVDAFEHFALSIYEYNDYKTEKNSQKNIFFIENSDILKDKISLVKSIYMARNIVNMPPKDANPEFFAKEISSYSWKNFDVEILGNKELRETGCNLIRAVGQGSSRESYMVILKPKKLIEWEKYGFIGKGVTFDAGGIQIKPDKAMLDMKCDMAGSAGFLGVALYLDSLEQLPVNTYFGFGFVENMTGSAAYKPLDIYTAYNWKTVEIHHTDAEWRLVLADVMSYVEKNFEINHLVTMATLTGACIYALGNDVSAIMGDDEDFISKIIKNNSPFEEVWRLPVRTSTIKSLQSEIADIKNISNDKAGSSVGGAFLDYFKWNAKLTHLDIAGPAYRTDEFGYMPKWWTGWGVKKISETILSL